MSGSFLRLDLDRFGMKAIRLEQRFKNALPREEYSVLFQDLPDPGDTQDLFDAGLDIIAQQIDLRGCSAALIFVSSLMVSFRNLELPFRSEKKISQVLSFELEPLLPYTHETSISVFHRIDLDNDSHLILTASLPELAIEKYFSRLKELGIKPVVITPKAYAAAISFLQERKDLSSFVFLHTTASEYTVVMVIDRKPCGVRALSATQYEPGQLNTVLKQTLLGFTQRTGLAPLWDVFICSDLDAEKTELIHRTVESYLESGLNLLGPENPNKPILEAINPEPLLSAITPDTRLKYLFNFCTGKYGSSSLLKTYFTQFAAGSVLAFILFSLWMFSLGTDIADLNKKIAVVDQKALKIYHETFPQKTKVQDPYLEMKANVKAALNKSGSDYQNDGTLKNQKIQASDMILELSKNIDPSLDVDASKLSFNEDRLVLSGSTDNFNSVDKIKSSLEGSTLFKKVTISSAAMDKKENRVNFKFIIEM